MNAYLIFLGMFCGIVLPAWIAIYAGLSWVETGLETEGEMHAGRGEYYSNIAVMIALVAVIPAWHLARNKIEDYPASN